MSQSNKILFKPGWVYQPENEKSILALNGVNMIQSGDIMLVTASQGSGKSGLCEVASTKAINKNIDGLGFEINLTAGKTVMYLDFERSKIHLSKSWRRMNRRAGIIEPNESDKVFYYGCRELVNDLYKREVLKKLIEELIEQHKVELLIMDGTHTMVSDVNNGEESNNTVRWFTRLADQFELGILITIHSNPGDVKPHGGYGSQLLKLCSSSLLLKYNRKTGVRTLTSVFEHGKVRADVDRVETYFKWDEQEEMFVSCTKPESENKLSNADLEILAKKSLTPGEGYSRKQVIDLIIRNEPELTEDNAIYRIKKMVEHGVLQTTDTVNGKTYKYKGTG